MSEEQIEAERVRFEAAWRKRYGYAPNLRFDRDGDGYAMPGTHFAWVGWLARAEQEYAAPDGGTTPNASKDTNLGTQGG